ncbi:MAG TPA: hypothetical protein VGL19_03255 [Polyangiaceae bacterium]|jgi:Na+/proline symporter
MLTLVQEGGFPIWFVLLFGGLSLFCGARFALGPSRQRLRLTGALGLTTWLATLTAVCADFAAVGHHGPEFLSRHPELPLHAVVLQGVAESLSPAIVGLSMLTVCALLVALGCHRDPVDA